MAEDIHPFGENSFGEGPIPAVDPADLRRVWEMRRDFQVCKRAAGAVISNDFYKRICSPRSECRRGAVQGVDAGKVGNDRHARAMVTRRRTRRRGIPSGRNFPDENNGHMLPLRGFPFNAQKFLSQLAKS